jgi:hypothetical protein
MNVFNNMISVFSYENNFIPENSEKPTLSFMFISVMDENRLIILKKKIDEITYIINGINNITQLSKTKICDIDYIVLELHNIVSDLKKKSNYDTEYISFVEEKIITLEQKIKNIKIKISFE